MAVLFWQWLRDETPNYRDPAVVIDQLRQIYIEADLEAIDNSRYYTKSMCQEYTVSLNLQTGGPDPDPILDLFYWLRLQPELGRLLQPRCRQADRAAVDGR